ncbi:MAG: hypothetical protein ACYTGX_07210, partial [Planctomycetota bacterium]
MTTLRRFVAAALIAPIVALTGGLPAAAQDGGGAAGGAGAGKGQAPPAKPKKRKYDLRLRGQFGWGGNLDSHKGSFPGATQTGRWFPIWIEIENLHDKEPFKGSIRITPTGTDHSADRWIEMSQRVVVGPLSRARVRFTYRTWSAENAPNVSFRVSAVDALTAQSPRGGVIGNLQAPSHVEDGQLVVVVGASRDAAALATPLQKALGSTLFGRSANPTPAAARPVLCAPRDLPARFPEYDAADVIIWPRVEGDVVEPVQVQALAEWVRAGGTLILGVGDTAASGAILNLFPATVGPPLAIQRFDSLPIDTAVRESGPGTERTGAEVLRPLTRERRNPADAAFVEQTPSGPVAWVASQELGAGRVVLVGANLLAKPFKTDAGEFWRTLAGWPDPVAADGPGPDNELKSTHAAVSDPWGNLSESPRWQGQPLQLALTTAIADVVPAQDIPFGWLALFLGVYVLLVGPVDYLILRRINRLEWTFATFTVITVLVTGSAWGVSQYLKGGDMLLRAIEMRTSRANTAGARAEAVWGIFSNAHDDLTLSHTDPTAATGHFWIPSAERGGSMGRQCVIEATAKGVYTPVAPVRIWTTDWFHSVWSAGRPAIIEGTLTESRDGDGCGGLLKLTGDKPWRAVHVVYGDAVWRVATNWRAGDEIRVQPSSTSALSQLTAGWEKPPIEGGEALYQLETAAWNVMAASVGRRVGDA